MWWMAYLAMGAVATALYLFVPPFQGSGPLLNGLGLASVIAMAIGIRMHHPRAQAAWMFMTLGQFLFWAGDLYTYSYPELTGADVPFPSFGDAIYLLVYPVLLIGLFMLIRRRNPEPDRSGLVESAILTVGIALLSWVFLIAPNIHAAGLTRIQLLVSVAYPLGDVLLLAGVVRLAVDRGKRAPAFYLLAGSIVCLLTTDSIYNYVTLQGFYHHQLWLDTGWIWYYLLWAASALHPSMRTLEEPAVDHRTRLTPLRLLVLSVAALIAPGIRFWQEWGNTDALLVIAGSAILFLLVVARMALLVREEERTAARELALRNAGATLVGAADPPQVQDAAVAAATGLVRASTVRLVALSGGDAEVVATSDEGAGLGVVPGGPGAWLASDAASADGAVDVPLAVRAALGIGQTGTAIALPLSARDEARGVLVVATPQAMQPSTVGALRSLAMQVSLALEGATLAQDLHRRRSEARFRSLVAHSSDMITVVDRNGVVQYQSPAVEKLLGYTVDEVEGTDFGRFLREADRPRLAQVMEADGALRDGHVLDCALCHRDGTWLQFEVQHTNLLSDPDVAGIVLNSRDVSERRAFEEQLAHQAFHDPVTKLANRALFADRVKHALARSGRDELTVGVMFIDLDDFKTVNDSLGHAAGDTVLQEVAKRLEATVRPTDTVARFGGDEFAVLLEAAGGSSEAADVAERILTALDSEVQIDGQQIYPKASVGICMSDSETSDAEELLRNADLAMYMAKRDRKGGYRMFEPAMHAKVVERLELRSDLERAIELRQLEVHYQPVVRLDGDSVYGVEALLRWTHPTRGSISPVQFIPIAEETGLIVSIGRWVLREACAEAAELNRDAAGRPLVMSVNLSVKQLQSDSIVKDVSDALEESGLSAGNLVLEITESVMMADVDLAVRRLEQLKSLGVRLAMDDFGTGYSSLSYLSRFPVDILKMDRSFLASRHTVTGLAAAIVGLGASLGLDVVAEGIELPEQITSLRDLGCELGQGFLFAKAMSRSALNDYLHQDGTGSAAGDEPESESRAA
jgi:diguanylate cyclase (GGDEF)-like protein/PAS domain S-box-containing protein